MALKIVTEGQDCNGCCHLGLYSDGYIKNQLLALLHSSSLENELLVSVRACSKVAERRNGVALDLFVFRGPKQVNKGPEEPCLNDGRFIQGVNRDVSDTGDSR